MRFFYELYNDAGEIVEEGEVRGATYDEATTKADIRLSEVLPNAEIATFGVFEWPDGEDTDYVVEHTL